MTASMSLQHLLEGWVANAPDLVVNGLSLDSRRLRPGEAFVALQGGDRHGADFIDAAISAGCRAVLTDGLEPVRDCPVPVIDVPWLGEKLGELGSRFHLAPSEHLTVAGVTGTNGKSSVAHFLAQSWQRVHGRAGIVGTLGYGPIDALSEAPLTTPDALRLQGVLAECLDAGVEHLAMEVSSHALQQGRCQTVQFDAAVFTNLSREHLDYHADMQTYAATKLRLFTDYLPRFCIVNRDDPFGREWIGGPLRGCEVLTYGLQPGAELTATRRQIDADGMTLSIHSPWGVAEVRVGLLGEFNVSNLLAAAGTLALLDMSWGAIVHELEMMQPVPGRMMRVGGRQGQTVVIDYAHTPDALQQALGAVREHAPGRLVCVFGCGGNRDRGKRPQMGRIAESLADSLIVTSDNPRDESPGDIIQDVLSGMRYPERVHVEPGRAEAIRHAILQCAPGDIVLIAGKGHEQWQEAGGRRTPFSDVATVRAALEEAA